MLAALSLALALSTPPPFDTHYRDLAESVCQATHLGHIVNYPVSNGAFDLIQCTHGDGLKALGKLWTAALGHPMLVDCMDHRTVYLDLIALSQKHMGNMAGAFQAAADRQARAFERCSGRVPWAPVNAREY